MTPRGIVFTPRREQAVKQHPFNDKKRAPETKAKRHPQTCRPTRSPSNLNPISLCRFIAPPRVTADGDIEMAAEEAAS